jgi:nucleotide-binding universal stress UspA family protein
MSKQKQKKNEIVVPIDFSGDYGKSLNQVVAIAKKQNMDITLFHVVSKAQVSPVPEGAQGMNPLDAMKEEQVALEKAEESLFEIAKSLQAKNVHVRYITEPGQKAAALSRYIQEENPAIVVMCACDSGRHLNRIFDHDLSYMAGKLEIPSLCLPIDYQYQGFERILYVATLTEGDILNLTHLSKFAKKHNSLISVAYFTDDPEMNERLQMKGFKSLGQNLFLYNNIQYQFRYSLNIYRGIQEYAQLIKADLISLNRKESGFFKSRFRKDLTDQLMGEGELPLLVY